MSIELPRLTATMLRPRLKARPKLPVVATAILFISACSCSYWAYCVFEIWPPIRSDGFGYYAYLPSVFIDHDLRMKTPIANRPLTNPPDPAWGGISVFNETSRILDKYTLGTAILQSPFFVVAHLISRAISDELATGYSLPYQIANVLSAIVYLCFGTYLLLRLLLQRFSTQVSLITMFLIVFATNVFHYGTFDGCFSHYYSFVFSRA